MAKIFLGKSGYPNSSMIRILIAHHTKLQKEIAYHNSWHSIFYITNLFHSANVERHFRVAWKKKAGNYMIKDNKFLVKYSPKCFYYVTLLHVLM